MDEAGYHAITDMLLDRLMVRRTPKNACPPTEIPTLRPKMSLFLEPLTLIHQPVCPLFISTERS